MPCGKINYTTREAAHTAAEGFRTEKRQEHKKEVGDVYFCGECKAWHLASKGKNKNKRRNQARLLSNKQEMTSKDQFNKKRNVRNEQLKIRTPNKFKIK
jgi:hypothetical protein